MYIYFAQVYNISLPNIIIWVQIRGIDCRGERVGIQEFKLGIAGKAIIAILLQWKFNNANI